MAKIRYWDKLKKTVERGKKGLNRGIPFGGFTTLSKYILNIQQGRYDLIFAGSSVGKTAYVNSAYVYGAIEFLQSNPDYPHDLEVIYYSLEIPPEHQIAKHIAGLIWEDYKILTNLNEILSRGDAKIRPEIEQLIAQYEEKMDEIQNKYLFYRSSIDPDGLERDLFNYAKTRGQFVYNENDEIVDYIPNNPGLITEVVIDHIGLIGLGSYKSLKEAMDKASKVLVYFRNMCNFSPVVISQINRGSEGMDRRDNDSWLPMPSDVKNSGNIYEDCNVAVGIASPFYYNIDKFLGFDITKYRNRYRVIKICKNRDGDSNLLAHFLFIGEIGKYYQLPDASEIQGKPQQLKEVDDYYKSLYNN